MANIKKMFFYFNFPTSSEKGVKEIAVSWDIIRGAIHEMPWSKIREYFVSQSLKRRCCRWIISDVPKDVADKFIGAEVFSNDYFEFQEPVAPVAPEVPERTDLVIPGPMVRDENGRVIGCDGLSIL